MMKILLADEVKLFLEMERSFLKRTGCEVLTADSGPEALEVARSERPDLILLDPALRGIDGLACCRAIRSDPELRATPVVFVGTPADPSGFTEAGGSGFVPKPITRERLLEVVRRFLPLAERDAERLPIALSVEFSRGGSEGLGFTRDLGPTGLFLRTHEALAPGDLLDLTFTLPVSGATPIRAAARVVRVVAKEAGPHLPVGVGLRFEGLRARDRLEISRFVRERVGSAP